MSLMAGHVSEIEDVLRRPLDDEDLSVAASTAELSPVQEANLRAIAKSSRPLAVAYLHAIVPGAPMRELFATLDRFGLW